MTSVDYHKPSGNLQRATELAFCAVFFFLPISKPMLYLSLALALGLFIASGQFALAWRSRRLQAWMLPAAILAVLPFLSLFLHENLAQSIDSLDLGYYWLVAAISYFAASRYNIRSWMHAFVAGIFVVFCFERIIVVVFNRVTATDWIPTPVMPAAMGNYILYSQFLAIGFVLLSVLYKHAPRRSVRMMYLAAMGLLFAGLLSGNGRSGLLVALVLLPFVFSNIFFRQSRARIFLGCLAALLIVLISPKVQHRIAVAASDVQLFQQGITQTSLGYRFDMWDTALEVIRAHPLAGAGTSGFREAWLSVPRSGQGLEFVEPHNAFLFFATSYGLIGFFALIWLYAALLWTGWTHRHSLEGGIVFAFAVICIVGSLTNTMFMGTVSHLWMMLFIGLQGSLLRASKSEAHLK